MHGKRIVPPTAALFSAAVLLVFTSSAGDPLPVFTNHAGVAVSGAVVAYSSKEIMLSNSVEKISVPITVFPKGEQRRIAADYAKRSGDLSVLRLPPGISRSIAATEKSVRRSGNRLAKGLCSEAEAKRCIGEAKAALESYLDNALKEGQITAEERNLLR